MILFLDFETVDKHLKTLGAGWAHGKDFKVIGYSYYLSGHTSCVRQAKLDAPHLMNVTPESCQWSTSLKLLKELVEQASAIVCHKAQYDVGILLYLGIDYEDKTIIDTMLLAKMYDNRLLKYDLDGLVKKYNLSTSGKFQDTLAQVVIDNDLYTFKTGKKAKTADIRKAKTWAMENLDKIYELAPELVIGYCNRDVYLTIKLYKFLTDELNKSDEEAHYQWTDKFSCLIKLLIHSRMKGVKVDLRSLRELRNELQEREQKTLDDLQSMIERDIGVTGINFNSSQQLRKVADGYGLRYKVRENTGNAILDKPWLDSQTHPFCTELKEYRRLYKLRNDFCDKILDMQIILPRNKRGYVYPEFNILGAETGRLSCRNPNIQQIPSRDEELAPLLRKCFTALEGYKFYQMDYPQQELRIFAHYCNVLNIDKTLKFAYDKDMYTDYHTLISELINVERKDGKQVTLGSMYGMGRRKLVNKLMGLGLSQLAAEQVYDQYHSYFPAVKQFANYCSETLKERGFVYTLLRRRSLLDSPTIDKETGKLRSFEYQGISKVIQGSAADQMIEVCVQIYKQGLKDYFLFSIHDQVTLIAKDKTIAEKVADIMVNCVPLTIPLYVDIGEGDNWASAESVKK